MKVTLRTALIVLSGLCLTYLVLAMWRDFLDYVADGLHSTFAAFQYSDFIIIPTWIAAFIIAVIWILHLAMFMYFRKRRGTGAGAQPQGASDPRPGRE